MKQIDKFMIFGLAVIVLASIAGSSVLAAAVNNTNPDKVPWELGGLGLFTGALCFVWLVAFIIEIAIAVWMYKDAEKRGKSGALWLIIGLLFGLIGLIVWLIVRPPEPSFYEKKATEREPEHRDRICPSCGRTIPFDAKVCPYCGKNFEE